MRTQARRTTKLKRRAAIAVAGLAIPLALADAALAAPFSDGSFESPPVTSGYVTVPGGATVGPWTVTGHSVDQLAGTGAFAVAPQDGLVSLDLNGDGAGGVCQTFDTAPGQPYQVGFFMSRNVVQGAASSSLRVDVSGGASQTFVHNATGTSSTTPQWQPHTLGFVAPGPSSVLCFTSLAPSDPSGGALIDNVLVAPGTAPPAVKPKPSFTANGSATRLKTRVRIRITGHLVAPGGVSAAQACTGKVVVAFKRGDAFVITRTLTIDKQCKFGFTAFVKKSKVKSAKKLAVGIQFLGNGALAPAAKVGSVKVKS